MKLTTEQDSYYGASEYTDPDYEPTGREPDRAGKGWSVWMFLIMMLGFCSLLSLCTAVGL